MNKRLIKHRLLKFALSLGVFSLLLAGFFSLFHYGIDMPIERELKQSNRILTEHYQSLKGRYDSLLGTLENLQKRDSAIYHFLYRSEPFQQNKNHSEQTASHLETLSNRELGELFAHKLTAIEGRLTHGTQTVDTLANLTLTQSTNLNRIPSTQPIVNDKLDLLAASFGEKLNPFYQNIQMHEGFDYNIPVGTAVFATADGVVTRVVSRGHTNGLSITINHQNGYTTVYSFLSYSSVRVGSRVKRGELIALSGNSGLSYAPHLHYEVRYKNKPVDPLYYMFMELDPERLETLKGIAKHAMQALE